MEKPPSEYSKAVHSIELDGFIIICVRSSSFFTIRTSVDSLFFFLFLRFFSKLMQEISASSRIPLLMLMLMLMLFLLKLLLLPLVVLMLLIFLLLVLWLWLPVADVCIWRCSHWQPTPVSWWLFAYQVSYIQHA